MTGARDFDRIEAERLRRLQQCFDADRPNSSELRSAMQRWHLSQIRSERRLPIRVSRLIVGAMLLSGGAMAATRVAELPVWRTLVSWTKPSKAPAAPSKSRRAPCFIQRAGYRVDCKPSMALKLAPGEQATVHVNDAKTELLGPGVAHVRLEVTSDTWVSQFEPQGWAPAIVNSSEAPAPRDHGPSTPVVQNAPANQDSARHTALAGSPKEEPLVNAEPNDPEVPAPTPASSLDGAWSRAAAALRHGDDTAARSALSEISQSPDPAARDAALLARAQLDLAAGRRDKAMPLLSQLSHSGATPFIRQRAQEIIVSGR